MFRKSRSFSLAWSVIASVVVALASVSIAPRVFAAPPAQQAAPQKSAEKYVQDGLDALAAGKPDDAINEFNGLKNNNKRYNALGNGQRALLDYLIATAYYQKEDWPEVERRLVNWTKDWPKGTEDERDDKIATVVISLADVRMRQEKWGEAREALSRARKLPRQTSADRLRTEVVLSDVVQKEAEATGDQEKIKIAYATAEGILKTVTAGQASTPELVEAKQKLVQLYMKEGKQKEAEALKNEIDSSGAKDPGSVIRSNIQGLSLGDNYFTKGLDEFEDAIRDEYLNEALQRYQKTLRQAALVEYFNPALEAARAELDEYKKTIPEGTEPNEAQSNKLEKLQDAVDELEDYKKDFAENKDYDALISFRIGACLFLQKRYWEAYVAFKDVVDNHPDFSEISTASYYYILCLRNIGKDDEAQKLCKTFLEKYPDREETGEVALLLGQISSDHGDYEEAIKNYQWAKANAPKLDKGTKASLDFCTIQAWFSRCPWGILTESEKQYVKENMGKQDYVPQISKATQETIRLIDQFVKDYGNDKALAGDVETMQYCRGLLYFYSGSYREAIEALNNYIENHPRGVNIPDARYRRAVTQFGVKYKDPKRNEENLNKVFAECRKWITDYFDVADSQVLNENSIPKLRDNIPFNTSDKDFVGESIVAQLPEIYTLMGDAYKRMAEDINTGSGRKAKKLTNEQLIQKQRATDDMLRAYILAAKTAIDNRDTLDFALGELDKTLPQRGEFERIRDIYQELYNRDPDSPDAFDYLNKILSFTEKTATQFKKPDDVDDETFKEMRKEALTNAKNESKKRLAEAILRNFNDPSQENVELLIGDLSRRLASQIKRTKKKPVAEGEPPPPEDPNAYTDKKATEELFTLLKLSQTSADTTLIGRARGLYARAMIYGMIGNREEYNRNLNSIATSFNADELSPTILGLVGDYLYERSKTERLTSPSKADETLKKAEEFYDYLMNNYRSSSAADTGFLGCGNIALDKKDYRKAYEIFDDAIKNEVAYNHEPEIRIGHARALIAMSDDDARKLEVDNRFDTAHKELNLVSGVKEWKGMPSAAALFYKGQLEEARNKPNEALNNYRLCYISWKKYPEYAARAMLRAGVLLEEKLHQPEEAAKIYYDLTHTKKYVDDPTVADVMKEAKSRALKRPYTPPSETPAAVATQ